MSSKPRAALLAAALAVLAGALVALAASPARAQAVDDTRDIELFVGEQTSIPARDVKQYSEGASGIVDVRLPSDGSQFLIVGLKPGTTTLMLIMRDGTRIQYTIRVSSRKVDTVPRRENIRLDFYFVELSSSSAYQIGIGWPSSIGGASVLRLNATYDLKAGELSSATALVTNQALPRLDILHGGGWAQILRQAALITANGNEATYTSGGEVNIAVQGSFAAEIRKIEYGSSIRVLPNYDTGTGRIELHIVADVSDLTNDSGSGVPGRTVSKLDTVVNLEPGQAVLLAGVNGNTRTRSRTGVPFFSQLPIIGALFGSHGGRNDHTQNVLFIIPSVMDPVSPTGKRNVDDALTVYDRYFSETQPMIHQPGVRRGASDDSPVPERKPKGGRR